MIRMKKTKQPGDNISLKTKKTEDPLVMQWLNSQTNLMDSLRYLIEREIVQNGVRNLQVFVPVERSVLQGSAAMPQEIAYVPHAVGNHESAAAVEDTTGSRDDQQPGRQPELEPEPPTEEEIDDDDIEAWI
ncbi:hypothetical protein DFP97_114166 [Paenibacillus prosopidis]|uniref:Uncharacterized protein n=2 Tax=Paenibacillus prosopidis TaxID=630520 RepID=A0A368VN07_9BACL|nr:hypothetical protein DFP97_114166 [Paenibacillus prosopidis]